MNDLLVSHVMADLPLIRMLAAPQRRHTVRPTHDMHGSTSHSGDLVRKIGQNVARAHVMHVRRAARPFDRPEPPAGRSGSIGARSRCGQVGRAGGAVLLLTFLAAACAAPVPVPPVPVPPPAGQISQEEAVAIARRAATELRPFLQTAPVTIARRDRYGDVRDGSAPEVELAPPDEQLVWTINLYDAGTQQGAVVIVDARDGRVLGAHTYIQ